MRRGSGPVGRPVAPNGHRGRGIGSPRERRGASATQDVTTAPVYGVAVSPVVPEAVGPPTGERRT
ncbi:hypothetical protein GCM10010328_51340 [Streptomyces rubiginosohelvolus]|uniref:Uncharacterized protein n=1 Tax=Streptomyces rubiginosohelvolus TaxID=67362 RepID=A0ABQ3C5X0_9ACTN|nr:hypothetical protein GCM10010328_51340 [Streptomyces pluricolorescens]